LSFSGKEKENNHKELCSVSKVLLERRTHYVCFHFMDQASVARTDGTGVLFEQ
jgi:hypothetical protein